MSAPETSPAVIRPAAWLDGKALLQWLAALLVSGGLLAYLFSANEVDPRELRQIMGEAAPSGLVAFVAVSFVALILRALRYWVLLERRVGLWPITLVTLVRNLFVDLLPARTAGAASYLYLVTARLGLPLSAGLASFTLSFVLDTLAIAPLLLLALVVVGAGPLPGWVLLTGSLLILVGGGLVLVLLAPGLRLAGRWTDGLPGRLARLGGLLATTAAEVERLKTRRLLGVTLGLSLALRLAKFGAYYCLLQALLIERGFPWGSLNFLQVFLTVAGSELAASLPLPTVASLGPYEVAGAYGLVFWLGIPKALAVLAASAFHLLSQVHDYGLGILALLWIMGPWARRRS